MGDEVKLSTAQAIELGKDKPATKSTPAADPVKTSTDLNDEQEHVRYIGQWITHGASSVCLIVMAIGALVPSEWKFIMDQSMYRITPYFFYWITSGLLFLYYTYMQHTV
ncbi:hypothetical protein BGP75_01495 [Motiliproteus sp. MSK22-1]|nr:hypothetical protein BGP75_01495 [Motiliproteus sp. MSK22-1]